MSLLDAVAARLSRPDMLQAAVLLFVALGFTLAVGWPTGISLVNEAWFSLAPVRTSALAFGALGYGAALGARTRPRASSTDTAALPQAAFGSPGWRREAAVTLGALAVLAAVTAPFEVVSHAASFPGTDVVWSSFVPFLALGGYFGMGLLLGRGAALTRLSMALPLLVPAALAGGVWLDVSLGRTLVNPWTAALSFSPALVAVLGSLSVVSLWAVLPRHHATSDAATAGEVAA